MLKIIFATFLVFFCLTSSVQATKNLDVVINEIAWMGTETSYSDEWIELYNNTNNSINLSGWTLKAIDGSPEIKLTGIIPASSFYLLERTNESTVPNISADQIYSGSLNNSGEKLKLYDNSQNLIDSVDCSSEWFAGNNKTKNTMERKNPLKTSGINNWSTSKNLNGTPKAKNSTIQKNKNISLPFKIEQINYPSNIIINELLPSPIGPDAEEEWIEIFNNNNFEVNLFNWKINDSRGKTKTYIFPKETKIVAQGFLILFRNISKIILNNDGDSISLIQPNNNIIDSVTYPKAQKNESYNKINSEWLWSDNLTPGSINIISTLLSFEKIETKAPKTENQTKKELATINKNLINPQGSFNRMIVALSIALFSGTIILILKRNLN